MTGIAVGDAAELMLMDREIGMKYDAVIVSWK